MVRKEGKEHPGINALLTLNTRTANLFSWIDQRLGFKARPRFWMVFSASALVTALTSQYLMTAVCAPLGLMALMAADFLGPFGIYFEKLSPLFASFQPAWTAFASAEPGLLAPGRSPVDWWIAFIWNNLIGLMNEPVAVWFVSVFGLSLGLGGVITWIRRPDHLTVSAIGFQFAWQGRAWIFRSPVFPWQDLTGIYVKTDNLFGFMRRRSLCFEFKNGTAPDWWTRRLILGSRPVVKIGLDRLTGGAESSTLLKLIESKGQVAAVDPEAINVLAPGMGGSYTQLWLKALESPATEKTEPELPGCVGSLLHDGRYKVNRLRKEDGMVREYDVTVIEGSSGEKAAEYALVEYRFNHKSSESGSVDDFSTFLSRAEKLRSKEVSCLPVIHDCFVENQCGYILLCHAEGVCLREIVGSKGRQTIEMAVKLTYGLCDSLKELHEMEPPMMAVSISPDCLAVTRDARLVLTSLDLVRSCEMIAQTSAGHGAYLAPEVLKGKVSTRSDVFAVGAVLYFLLTGADPKSPSAMRPREEVEEIGYLLDAIVARATEQNPEMRYRSLSCLMADLDVI